jgi:hypothetical protein
MLMPNSIVWLMKLHVYVPCELKYNCSRNETPSSNFLVHWCVECVCVCVCVIINRESEHVIVNYIGIKP